MPGGVVAPPALVAAWQTDAYPHGIRAGRSLTIISLIFTSIALVIVFARLYDRVLVRHNAGLDDALIVAALFPLVGLCICTVISEYSYGFDRHTWDLTPEIIAPSRKLVLAISVLSLSTCGLIKISILLFYRRIGDVKPWFRTTININIAFIVGYTLAFSLAIPLECTPTSAYWNKANPLWTATHTYHCINEGAKQVSAGALSALQDLIACVLPMALFWDLRISKRSKLALCFVFGLGLFTCACGIMRTVKLHFVFFETYDVTWAARWVFALTLVEACLGAICASVPALKNSFQRLLRVVVDPFVLGGSSESLQTWHRTGEQRDQEESGSKAVRRRSKNPFFFEASERELVNRQNIGAGGSPWALFYQAELC
ncbi:integral membrane protein [Neofusicoccum parvum]|uniref:Integral membrane protein n=1 Tax=Neofusicoccum parvum TaxID=310453 RepID=A0ACB5S694_9PEZI|nr:integral membrane protein [Neofusicoccum parvum]